MPIRRRRRRSFGHRVAWGLHKAVIVAANAAIDGATRLRFWLQTRGEPPPPLPDDWDPYDEEES